MAVVVKIPTPLRKFTGGQRTLEVTLAPGRSSATVGEVLDELVAGRPELERALFVAERQLKPMVRVFVGERDIAAGGGLSAEVTEGAVVSIVPPVAGA